MRIYRLTNKAKNGAWVLADTVDEAKQLFLKAGRVKSVNNIIAVDDQTNFYLRSPAFGAATRKALADGIKGTGCINLNEQKWEVRPIALK
jgi:hypothetical protein